MPAHNHKIDQVGIAVSLLCLIHCLCSPLLIIALPWLDTWIETPWAHLVFLVGVAPLAIISFYRSYIHHRKPLPLALGLIGIVLLLLGMLVGIHHAFEQLDHLSHHSLPVLGSLFIIAAHLINIKWCHTTKKSHCSDSFSGATDS